MDKFVSNDGAPQFKVSLSAPSINERDIETVVSTLRTGRLSLGPQTAAFEHDLARYVGVREAVAVSSGTGGLHVCLAGFEVGVGDEVITSPFSFVATSNAILYVGGRPVFVDIEPETLAMDPNKVEAAMTRRTRALLPVDVFGQPAPMEQVGEIARRHQLVVIEDACEAIGAERNGIRAGSTADAAVFAFYPNKQITTGEGGMIVTDDVERAKVFRSLANQGRDDNGTWMNHVRLGFNYRMDEMSAALGRSQLGRIDEILERRDRVASWYNARLASLQEVATPVVVPETTRMSWFVYVIRLDEGISRDALLEELALRGVPTRPYFVPIHLQPFYRRTFGFRPGDFPVTERVGNSTLALPFFSDMTPEQVDFVATQLEESLKRLTVRRLWTSGMTARSEAEAPWAVQPTPASLT